MKQKKKTKKRNKTNIRNKAMITTIVISALFALSLSLTVWAGVADASPKQLLRALFKVSTPAPEEPAGPDGVNLFKAASAKENGEAYIYDAIELAADTDYLLFFHADSVEDFGGYDGMASMLILVFSDVAIDDNVDLNTLLYDEDGGAPEGREIMYALGVPYQKIAFSTRAYLYKYLTVISPVNLAETAFKLKIERGLVPTAYTAYGVGTTELYTPPAPGTPADEEPSPTPLIGGQINSLYLNTTEAGSAVLNSITEAGDATVLHLSPNEDGGSDAYTAIRLAILPEIKMLAIVIGPDDEQEIVPLWFSASGFDLSVVGLEGTTVAGWQSAASGDIAEQYGISGWFIQEIDGQPIKYSAWGDNDAELGRQNFNNLFSLTPFTAS